MNEKIVGGENANMNSNEQEMLATIYLNIDCTEISSFIFVTDDVLFGRKTLIEHGDEIKISELAVALLRRTVDFTPPSLFASINKRGVVVSGGSIPDDICATLQQATGIHASTVMEASDVDALSVCQAWLKSCDD